MAGLMPQRAEGAEPLPLAIFNGAALPASALQGIGEPFGLRPEMCAALGGTNGRMQDAAAALALLGARNDSLPMDFLHSHLEVRRGSRSKRQVAWTAALAGAALVAGGLYLADWRAEQREVEALQSQLAQMKPDVEVARAVVQQARLARGWTDRRPSFLDPLRELTLAFPTEGRIWVTSLGIHQDMRVVVTGKASDEGTVLSLLDRVKGKPAFSGVKMQYRRDAGANSREVSFNLSFAFMNKE